MEVGQTLLNRYRLDANQEMVALGLGNVASALTQGLPIGGSGCILRADLQYHGPPGRAAAGKSRAVVGRHVYHIDHLSIFKAGLPLAAELPIHPGGHALVGRRERSRSQHRQPGARRGRPDLHAPGQRSLARDGKF